MNISFVYSLLGLGSDTVSFLRRNFPQKERYTFLQVSDLLRSFFYLCFRGLLKQELKKQLKKTKNPEEVDELKNRLSYVVSGPFFCSLLLSSYC